MARANLLWMRARRKKSEPSCRHRIQLLEDSGILREREQKLRCVAVNGRSRHASGVRDVHSQQTTAREARYCANQRNWENWDMEASINNFQQWLKRHKVDDVPGNSGGVWPKREKHWFSGERKDPVCIFCKGKHWVDAWEVIKTMEARRHFFQEKELCFNCGRTGPWGKFCRSRGFYNCKSKHHTGLSNRARGNETETPLSSNAVLNGYTPSFEEKSLPANSPFETQRDHILGVSRHRIREELNLKAINRLGLKPPRHESRQIVTVNGTKKQSLSVFSEKIKWVRK